MVNGAARVAPTLDSILSSFNRRFQLLEADLRQRRGFQSTETKPIGTSSGASTAGITGFLRSAGDQMTGPIAFSPAITTIVSGEVNISLELGQAYTSFVLLNPEGGTDDTLNTILGTSFPGQIIVFHVTNAEITFSNADNIAGNDTVVAADDNIAFIFDSIGVGKWRIWSGGASGGGGYNLIQDEGTSLPQRQTINFIGSGVVAVDNVAQNRTDIQIPIGEFFGPWTVTHNAGIQTLDNLRALTLVDVAGDADLLLEGITSIGPRFTLPVGRRLRIREGLIDIVEFSVSGIVMNVDKDINLNKNKLESTGSVEFDNTALFDPNDKNAIGYDIGVGAVAYHTAATNIIHRFKAGGENLVTISRFGPNLGAILTYIVTANIHDVSDRIFLNTFNNTSPVDGDYWRDNSTGLFQFRENGVTKTLAVGNFLPLAGGTMTGNINMDDHSLIDCDDISIHANSRILANSATEFGIQIDGDAAVIGSEGMLAMPQANAPVIPTKAQLDALYGTHKGAMGIDTGLLPHLFVRSINGDWFRFDVTFTITI